MDASPAPLLWRCRTPARLHLQAWEPQRAVVFNEASGHTHLLDALSVQALRWLVRHGPSPLARLAEALQALPAGLRAPPGPARPVAPALTPLDGPTLEQALAERLATLRRLGLVEAVAP